MWKYRFWYVRLKRKRRKIFKLIVYNGIISNLNSFKIKTLRHKSVRKWVKWSIKKRKENFFLGYMEINRVMKMYFY